MHIMLRAGKERMSQQSGTDSIDAPFRRLGFTAEEIAALTRQGFVSQESRGAGTIPIEPLPPKTSDGE